MSRTFRLFCALLGIGGGVAVGLTGYYFTSTSVEKGELSTWMGKLDGGKAISSLYIPGTHDTLARYALGDFSGKCQDLDLSSQLNAGARFLDLRYKLDGGDLRSCHGIVDERSFFSDDVKAIESFLRTNPSEFLFVSIKEESKGNGTASFEESIKKHLNQTVWALDSKLPSTVAEARGKAYLLSRYDSPTIGIDCSPSLWADNASFDIGEIHIQDHYKISKIETKKSAIMDGFQQTEKLKIHFYSGYLDPGFPISSALTVAKDINPWVKDAVAMDHSNGIAVMDFFTTTLAKEIIGRN